MGVHRNNNMRNFIHFFLSTNKKLIHTQNHLNEQVLIELVFYNFIHTEIASYQHNT